jgi:hypothetical protein
VKKRSWPETDCRQHDHRSPESPLESALRQALRSGDPPADLTDRIMSAISVRTATARSNPARRTSSGWVLRLAPPVLVALTAVVMVLAFVAVTSSCLAADPLAQNGAMHRLTTSVMMLQLRLATWQSELAQFLSRLFGGL